MLFPVIGKTLFSPGLLTKCFIQNVFPIAFTIEDACSIYGLEASPLGHALHDIGHAFLVINTKREKFKNDFKEICKDLPFNNVDDSKLFKKQFLQFLLTKNRAYETALAQTIAHFETQDNKEYLKKVLTGLFFAIHELESQVGLLHEVSIQI